ncbi:MAG: DIP1984 family protein [Lachnospiraceae bacterium]|nr:DIP1984 family protein [Lachnospiraceae bacterium]MBR0153978.1 DIP1984 family protein [Lachnospiraceae bacterium]
MKLAEALQERADLNRSIEQLRSRIQMNVLVQEGEKPAEDPQRLIKELEESLARLEELICKINLTNCKTVVDGQTLTELIAKKDVLKLRQSALRDIIYSASQSTHRARNTEIKIQPVVSVEKLQKQSDAAAKQLRLLENQIQQANWLTDLIES